MASLGNRRSGDPIVLKPDGLPIHPNRVPFTERRFEEGWLQELIRSNPQLLPVMEIEPAFTPLVPIGREVPTGVGNIDNLYLSPHGYLTIVETKLWRNPEARREVVGQIIDYAKEVNCWSYEQLESHVRAYNQRYRNLDIGVLETLRSVEQIDDVDEASLVDMISRNLQRGRFLLLVVGDGIRESVESMTEFLNQTPQLYFTLALVELRVYEFADDKSLLVVPEIVARTKEVTRAIVRVEGESAEQISVRVDDQSKEKGRSGTRYTLSEEDYFDLLNQAVSPKCVGFARQIIHDMEERGCVIEWKQASYVVKLLDPGGSGQKLTLFVVYKNGIIYTGWLPDQLRNIGLPAQIGYDFVRESAQLFDKCEVHPKYLQCWSREIHLEELHEQYDGFASVIQEVVDTVRDASSR